MDRRSREQYLESVRQEYRQASRKQKTRLLNGVRKRTRLNRKVLIRKLAHPPEAGIQMSRSRPHKKNDNAWAEQRNWAHVRKVVGYQRFDTTAELRLLREIDGKRTTNPGGLAASCGPARGSEARYLT